MDSAFFSSIVVSHFANQHLQILHISERSALQKKKLFFVGICAFFNICLHRLAYLWLLLLVDSFDIAYTSFRFFFISFVVLFGFCFDCAFNIEDDVPHTCTHTLQTQTLKKRILKLHTSMLAIASDENTNSNTIKQNYIGNFEGWKQWNWKSKCTKSPCITI